MADQRPGRRASASGSPPPRTRRWLADLPADLRRARHADLGRGAGRAVRGPHPQPRRRDRRRDAAGRERRHPRPAAARLRREPDRDLPRPRPGADAPLPRRLPLARARVRRARGRARRQARQPRVAARQEPRHVRLVRHRRGARLDAARSTRSWSTTPARAPRPSAARTPRSSTTSCRRWRARRRTATSPGSSSCSTSTRPCRRWTRPRRRRCAGRSGPSSRRPRCTTTSGWTTSRTTRCSTTSSCTSTAGCARSRTSRSATGCTSSGQPPSGDNLVNLVLAVLRANQVFANQVNGVPGLRVALGLKENESSTAEADAAEEQARALVAGARRRRLGRGPRRRDRRSRSSGSATPGDRRRRRRSPSPAARSCRGWRKTTDELTNTLHALAGGYVPAGPSGSPLRGLVNTLPTGRNFYSVDPKAVPSRLAWATGQAMADSLLQRYLDETGEYPASVGLSVWGTSAMRTSGDDIAEVLALLGVLPTWDEASRRVVGLEPMLARRARPAAHRRGRADLGLLPRRVPARGRDARRRRTPGRRPRRGPRGQLRPPPRRRRPRRARRRAPRDDADLRVQARLVRRGDPAGHRVRATGATTPTWPRSTRRGAGSRTGATSTASARARTWSRPTGGSRSRPRTSTPASTTSPTPTTTSSTTAAWSRPSGR